MEKRPEQQADGIRSGCLTLDYTLEFLLFSSLFFPNIFVTTQGIF